MRLFKRRKKPGQTIDAVAEIDEHQAEIQGRGRPDLSGTAKPMQQGAKAFMWLLTLMALMVIGTMGWRAFNTPAAEEAAPAMQDKIENVLPGLKLRPDPPPPPPAGDAAVDASLARLRFDLRLDQVEPHAAAALARPECAGQDRCNALFLLAEARAGQGRPGEARDALRELTRLRRHEADWLLLADCEKALGSEEGVVDALTAAVRINPRLWKAHRHLAEHYRRRGDEDPDQGRHNPRRWKPDPDRKLKPDHPPAGFSPEDGGGVRPHTHEESMPQGDLAGEAGENVEAESSDGEDERLSQHDQPRIGSQPLETGDQLQREGESHQEEHSHGDLLRGRRQHRRIGLVGGVEERPPSHTRRISSVPKRPYGRMRRTISMMK